MPTNLVTIETGKTNFTTPSGKVYYIESRLSQQRYAVMRKFSIWFESGIAHGAEYRDWKKVYDYINSGKGYADIAVLAHNKMEGIGLIDENLIPAVELCTLFINEEDEDRRYYNEVVMEAKKADWEEAGIEVGFFLKLAKAACGRLIDDSLEISQNSLTKEEEKPQNPEKD